MRVRSWWRFVTYRFAASRRRYLTLLLLTIAFGVGVVLAFISATPEVELIEGRTLEGVALPGTTSRGVDFPSVSFAEATLSLGECGLTFHLLRAPEWAEFNRSGDLPPADLTCNVQSARLPDGVLHVVIENELGNSSGYLVDLAFYRVVSPLANLALPGFLLITVGGLGVILYLIRRGLTRVVDDIMEK